MSLVQGSLRRSGSLVETAAVAARRAGFPALVFGFALAYYLGAKLGIATGLPPEGIVILWPPNAIVLAVLLSVKTARWPVFLLATLATEVVADIPDYPLLAAVGYGLVNFAEAALAATLLRAFVGRIPPIATMRDFFLFLLIGPVLASASAALLGAAIYKIGAPGIDYLHYWRVFWFGDAIGLLILGTAFLALKNRKVRLRPADQSSYAEGTVLALGLLIAMGWAFFADAVGPRVYLLFPFLLWSALRFGVAGASASLMALVAAAIGSAVNGIGPFAALTTINEVIALQGLIAIAAVSTYVTAFASEESSRTTAHLHQEVRKKGLAEERLTRAYTELERVNSELDNRVAQRTEELQTALARNELLLKEVHHRIKNNLQIVSSLLALHSRSISDPAARGKFADVQGQVGAIATVYDLIHQIGSADRLDFSHAVATLCERLSSAAGPDVRLSTTSDGPAPVTAETAVALSLAVNELITNSVKHAAAGGAVTVEVACRRDGDRLVVRIADDGPGFAPDFDFEHATGFGARMARSVVAQANGRLRRVPSQQGALVEISVPLAAESD